MGGPPRNGLPGAKMKLSTRKLIDRSLTGAGYFAILLVACVLLIILVPIFSRGIQAFVFQGTVEFRRLEMEEFGRGNADRIRREVAQAQDVRKRVYQMLDVFEAQLENASSETRRKYSGPLRELKSNIMVLVGPAPEERRPILKREQYGQTRWDRTLVKLDKVLYSEEYDYSDPSRMGVRVFVPRVEKFKGTLLEPLFPYLEKNIQSMMLPRWTFYWHFLTDVSVDSHIFGGIWPELLGTFYLTLGAVVLAVPIGVISAIYLVEYARAGFIVQTLRTFISTLAGVPSIVFGLFGLAFFINTAHVSQSKSVLAGSLTLALLILPVIIRASEEAIRAVPQTYKEASLSLGASRWRTVVTVILPAALPGILTGVIISMGRAAGETAPIIFTAAVSVGKALRFWEVFSQPTPALSWNIYNLATEHEAVDEIRHVQYGMVLTLVGMVLILNLIAIVLRARIMKKLKG